MRMIQHVTIAAEIDNVSSTNYAGRIAAALCVLSIFAAGRFVSKVGPCLTAEQAKAIAQDLSTELQQKASANSITVEALADGVRALNSESLRFAALRDSKAYCARMLELKKRLLSGS